MPFAGPKAVLAYLSRYTHRVAIANKRSFVRRIERGFDFLGYHFGPDGRSVAKKTIENFVALAIRLYEQEPGEVMPPPGLD